MSCITLSCYRIGDGISASSSRVGEGVAASVSFFPVASYDLNMIGEGIDAYASLIGDRLAGMLSRVGDGIKASVSIICSLSDFRAFLNVSPEEVQWITDEIGIFYDVESNVEWVVLTS